jgi:capsular exopolysaccharide synthesis family protein
MAKVYEALRRAEEERKRKVAGGAAPIPAVGWDPTPQTAPSRPRRGFRDLFRRTTAAERRLASGNTAADANRRRISLLEPESFIAEQFRMLRSRIDALALETPLKTIAVTSAHAGEGKSNISINLAVVTAMSVAHKVLLIDCDLRRPTVHRSLGIDPQLGLAEVLMGRCTASEAIVKVEGTNLDLLGVRLQPQNPSELLGSRAMRDLLAELSGRYDRIILDTPATLGLPDSKIVAGLCDGYLMVVRAGETAREEVEAALEVLDRRRAVGLVLNGAELGHERYAYY